MLHCTTATWQSSHVQVPAGSLAAATCRLLWRQKHASAAREGDQANNKASCWHVHEHEQAACNSTCHEAWAGHKSRSRGSKFADFELEQHCAAVVLPLLLQRQTMLTLAGASRQPCRCHKPASMATEAILLQPGNPMRVTGKIACWHAQACHRWQQTAGTVSMAATVFKDAGGRHRASQHAMRCSQRG